MKKNSFIGGTFVATQKVTNGKLLTRPEAPTKEGYIFVGWYLEDEVFDFNRCRPKLV